MIKITIAAHPYKSRLSVIYLEGEPWREIASSLVRDRSLEATYSSLRLWESAWQEFQEKTAKALAFQKLSRKRYFRKELQSSLLRYGLEEEVLEKTLSYLESLDLLNDKDSTESVIAKGIREKKGPAWISNKLRLKGSQIPEDFEALYPEELREEKIRELLKKSKKEGPKAINFVLRRGFSLSQVIKVYNEIK